MSITVIYSAKETTLTIDVPRRSEPLVLMRMLSDGRPERAESLRSGDASKVVVGPGVFALLSNDVQVSAAASSAEDFHVSSVENKDDPPDQPRMTKMFDREIVRAFIKTAGVKGGGIPGRG